MQRTSLATAGRHDTTRHDTTRLHYIERLDNKIKILCYNIIMLSHKYRFHSRGGVRYVLQKGRTIRSSAFSLIYTPNYRGFRRFGIVVSKKVLKSAVGRNRIRRRIYEALRLEIPNYQKPMDYLFVVYSKNVLTMPFSGLRHQVRELLDRSLTHHHATKS